MCVSFVQLLGQGRQELWKHGVSFHSYHVLQTGVLLPLRLLRALCPSGPGSPLLSPMSYQQLPASLAASPLFGPYFLQIPEKSSG